MSKARLLLAACFVMFAASALASSTASAAVSGWEVNGTLLVGSAAIASKVHVLSFGRLTTANVEIICKGDTVDVNGGFIVHPDEVVVKELVFHSCSVANAGSGCTLANELIATLPIHGLAELDEGNVLNTIVLALPLPTKTFAVLNFSGATCAIAGNQPVTQSKAPGAFLLIHDGGVSAVSHLVLVFSKKESLKLGSSEATLLEADGDVELASKLPVAFL